MGEQRQSERRQVRFKLIYDDSHTFNAGLVSDVSEGGVFLETALPLPVGTVVQLNPVETDADELFEIHASVVRVVPYESGSTQRSGMGLQFLNLTTQERKAVVEMIRRLEERESHLMQGSQPDPYLGLLIPAHPPLEPSSHDWGQGVERSISQDDSAN